MIRIIEALAAPFFSMMTGNLWEFPEFVADRLFLLNIQKNEFRIGGLLMFSPRYFWVPPVICGLLAAGCLSGPDWSSHIFADLGNGADSCSDTSQDAAGQKRTNAEPDSKDAKSQTDNQMERVSEIMRASTESAIQMLSDIFKNGSVK